MHKRYIYRARLLTSACNQCETRDDRWRASDAIYRDNCAASAQISLARCCCCLPPGCITRATAPAHAQGLRRAISLVLPCGNRRPSKALRLDAECPRHFIRLKVRMPNAKREVKSYPRRCSRRTPGVSLPLQLLCTSEATVEHVEDHPSGRAIR